ncbi:hypothetical protein [Microvirga terricola]|uniref:DUF3299 domain-containing protein n=1 Tax=Microvirga terricola TaxID=2719797 RepID=A0ABX0VCF5_9HYPH|nr:hypothetical protein [Microvirga terricola]NIX77534.1 hypothetical protein [Microvirga terricola]
MTDHPHLSLTRRRFSIGAALALFASPARAAEWISFDTLYKSFGVRGFEFADRIVALKGQEVSLTGYMAPPLRAESTFFVLTREPLAICPFCQSDADWPVDIVVIYLKAETPLVSAGAKIIVSGRLEVGSWTDPDSGFVSQIRIADASYRRV